MELDDIALPMANRWSAEQMQEQIDSAKDELQRQVAYTFGSSVTPTSSAWNDSDMSLEDGARVGLVTGNQRAKVTSQREKLGLPNRIKSFLTDVRNTAGSDGLEIGQFVGFSAAILRSMVEVVSALSGHECSEAVSDVRPISDIRSSISGDSDGDNLACSYLDLLGESLELERICAKTVTMAEGDDATSDFVSRERVEVHRVQLVDFLRRQLPMGVRPSLNKLPPFVSRKLVPDAETFQW